MSYTNFEKAIELIEVHKTLINGSISNPKEELIELAEKTLNVKFPFSYREFLKKFGYLAFGGSEIYGLIDSNFIDSSSPDVVWMVLTDRKKFGLPPQYIILWDLGDGFQ